MLKRPTLCYYVLVIGTTMNVSAYLGISNLQSSMNIEANLGTISVSILNLLAVFISMFITPFLVLRVGAKWTLLIGELGYIGYTAANVYPKFQTLIPGAIAGSVGEGLLWTAAPLYLNHLLRESWSQQTHEIEDSIDKTRSKWYGTFYGILKSSEIWGNVLSYAILYGGQPLNTEFLNNNTNLYTDISSCGSNFCVKQHNVSESQLHKYVPTSKLSVLLMIGLYLVIQIAAALMHIFGLPSIEPYNKDHTQSKCFPIAWNSFKTYIHHIICRNHMLLVPKYFYYGYLVSYSSSEFTKAFVSCTIGVQQVGLAMTLFGITNVVTSVIVGRISHRYGNTPIICFGFLFDLTSFIIQLTWRPISSTRYVVYAIGAMMGVSSGIWQITIMGNTARFFPKEEEEVAIGAVQMWCNVGLFVGFVLSGVIRVSVRIYSLIGILTISCVGYAVAEILKRREQHKENGETVKILNHTDIQR